jgi:hypothetical protein
MATTTPTTDSNAAISGLVRDIVVIKTRGGRTGRKIHRAYIGSSVLGCGHWLRVSATYFRVPDETKVTCENCMTFTEKVAAGLVTAS